jgi:hypothetical protein
VILAIEWETTGMCSNGGGYAPEPAEGLPTAAAWVVEGRVEDEHESPLSDWRRALERARRNEVDRSG